jgi:hypothetical protein
MPASKKDRAGHDWCSPSQLTRRYHCPGSVRLEQKAITTDGSGSSEAATRGTVLHYFTDMLLSQGNVDALRGHTEYNPTPADMHDVRWCAEQVNEIIEELQTEYPDAKIIDVGEKQLDLSALGISGGKVGNRVDRLIVVPGVLAVLVDYKFGQGFVPSPPYNWQFKAYAWGVMEAYGGHAVRAIKLQPATDEEYRRTEGLFTPSEVERFGTDIAEIVARTKEIDAPLCRGAHCTFCGAKNRNCPLWKDAFLSIPSHLDVTAHLERISPVERGQLYSNLKAAESFVAGMIKKLVAYTLDKELEFHGYEIGPGRGSRAWTDDDKAMAALVELAKDKEKDPDEVVVPPVPAKPVSPSEAEKVLGKAKAVKAALSPLIVNVHGKPTLKKKKEG